MDANNRTIGILEITPGKDYYPEKFSTDCSNDSYKGFEALLRNSNNETRKLSDNSAPLYFMRIVIVIRNELKEISLNIEKELARFVADTNIYSQKRYYCHDFINDLIGNTEEYNEDRWNRFLKPEKLRSKPQEGDVIIFFDKNTKERVHSGFYIDIEDNLILSKYGNYPLSVNKLRDTMDCYNVYARYIKPENLQCMKHEDL